MSSCRGTDQQVFCDDMNCGHRDTDGLHYPAGHPMNKVQLMARTAKEVAEEYLDRREYSVFTLAQALTAFANERVKEAQGEDVWKIIHKQRDRARAEALEEAASAIDPGDDMTEGKKVHGAFMTAAIIIRALKEKP